MYRDNEIAAKFFRRKERKLKMLADLISRHLIAPDSDTTKEIIRLGKEIELMDLMTELKQVYENNIDGKIGREILNRENKLDEFVRGDLWYYKIVSIDFRVARWSLTTNHEDTTEKTTGF